MPHGTLANAFNAALPTLLDDWEPSQGPLLVTVKLWSCGAITAELPSCEILAEGSTEPEALSNLVSAIMDEIIRLKTTPHSHKSMRDVRVGRNLFALVRDRKAGGIHLSPC